jgi:uncharacterized protein (DUF2062 family)
MGKELISRRLRYIYLRLIRLRGDPHELALGMAFGIFTGMLPIIPLHTVVAVALALAFRASKITAAVGTWICNPVTIYPVYWYGYKFGLFILGFDRNAKALSPVIETIRNEEFLHMITAILSAGGKVAAAFLMGGFTLGIIWAVPSYFIFLYLFKAFITWRKSRKLIKA